MAENVRKVMTSQCKHSKDLSAPTSSPTLQTPFCMRVTAAAAGRSVPKVKGVCCFGRWGNLLFVVLKKLPMFCVIYNQMLFAPVTSLGYDLTCCVWTGGCSGQSCWMCTELLFSKYSSFFEPTKASRTLACTTTSKNFRCSAPCCRHNLQRDE